MNTISGKSSVCSFRSADRSAQAWFWIKPLLALLLLGISAAASAAVQLTLLSHNQTSGSGTVSTLITDGGHVQGFAASTVTWTWDGNTLTGTGLYSATSSLGSSPFSPTILNDSIMDLTIDTGAGTAGATAYTCNEGTFLAGVGASGCGGYQFGGNYTDESATIWTGTAVSQTISGDDILTASPRTIAAYNFSAVTITGVDGLSVGDIVKIGNGTPVGTSGGEALTFQVVAIIDSAVDDSVGVAANSSATIDVLANDIGFQDPVSVDIVTPAANGSAVVNGSPGNQADISISYTPVTGFEGIDTFEYSVDDGVNQDTATVTVTVVRPAAVPDSVETFLNTAVDVDVLSNDGPFTEPVTVTVSSDPAHGSATVIGSPGSADAIRIQYTPVNGFSGTDVFEYQVSDGVNMDTGSVSITVHPFVAQDDEHTVLKNSGWNYFYVASNDIGFADPVSVTITSPPSVGTANVYSSPGPQSNVYIGYYVPWNHTDYTDQIEYRISSGANQDTATLTVHVVTYAALDDEATTAADQPITLGVTTNDLGFSYLRTVGIFTNPQHGTVVVTGSGGTSPGIIYTPDPGFLGDDVFEYAIDDGTYIDIAAVTVHVIIDQDGDLVDDRIDNCLEAPNPAQSDADGDGFGNWCDADLDNNGFVNFADLSEFRSKFATTDPVADLDASGIVNFADLARFKALFGKPPGPSALNP